MSKPDLSIEIDGFNKEFYRNMASFLAEEFANNSNPMDGLKSFVYSRAAGNTPPPEILDWLAGVFDKYCNLSHSDMDTLLGLRGSRGQPSPRAEHDRNAFITHLMYSMKDLIEVFKVGAGEAAYMVAARFDPDNDPDNPKAYGKYSADTLRQYWHKSFQAEGPKFMAGTGLMSPDPDELLKRYPEHVWPVY